MDRWVALVARRGCGIVVLLGLVFPCSASATFSGRNGILLFGSVALTPPGSALRVHAVRPRDCGPAGELYGVKLDGSPVRDLGVGDDGIFSPTGAKLAIRYQGDPCFGYLEGGGPDPNAGLYLGHADGSHRRRIGGTSLVGWLPTGQLIVGRDTAAASTLFDAISQRVLMTVPSTDELAMSCSGRVVLSRKVRAGYELDLFTRVRGRGTSGVRLVRTRLASYRYDFEAFDWSPSGRSVLFTRDEQGPNYDGPNPSGAVWRVGADGRGLKRLSHPGARQFDQVGGWSPDGRRITFQRTTWDAKNEQLRYRDVVMSANGSHPHAVADFESDNLGLGPGIWSPDSTALAIDIGEPDTGGATTDIVNATTGATEITIDTTASPFQDSPLDWQALPGDHHVSCADREAAPLDAGPVFTG